jgi:NAD-dependent dihydropyrimidine dehydrogenase PreA subunit
MGKGEYIMFVNARKYKDIYHFIKDHNQVVKEGKGEYIVKKPIAGASAYCGAIDYKTYLVDPDTCFSCMFCILKDERSKESYMQNDYLVNEFEKTTNHLFKGSIVEPIRPKISLLAKYNSLEDFTGIKETQHISPWSAGILEEISSKPVKIGLEVPVPNEEFDRPGRLDVCSSTEDYLLMFEAKISLEDALADERFIEQFDKYLSVIDNAVKGKQLPYHLILLIGGKETDLLYPDHPQCTSNVGKMSKRFYDILLKFNIKFISANALALMAMGFIKYGEKYSWDLFLKNVFNDANCVGLVTAGKIIYQNGEFNILSL